MLKQIVITGASSELGAYLLQRFSEVPETRIIATMRRSRRHDDVCPPNVRLLDELDLTKRDACEQLGREVGAAFSGAFGLIHSVGDFWEHIPFEEFNGDQAAKMLESHVVTLYNVLEFLLPLMKEKGGGSVVTFSCNSVRYNYPWMAAFTASKSAVDSLVRSLANEFSGYGIRLNSLVLASVKTRKVKQSKPNGDFTHFISPHDIFPVAQFLLSSTSFLINGNSIHLFEHSNRFFDRGYFERISK